ncbi:MAG: TRAP transporter substrate-binding protein DctP [Halobacteriovoraceae bacterium]|jgi:TRAP-type transport system periplasmic protein|nr:TRAP transporter substrate-binding protein DctP [Halobacteriovoraceae bacterium]MBT5094760.1 TRAP transporter substrate-binding protein DctP [Halobacteriovoraceae bacterium]
MKKLLLVLSLLFSSTIFGRVTIKVGVLAPEGTNWAKNLKKMAKEIKKATNNEVRVKIYFGGAQGDEPDVLRKIRVGQLQGGVFTGKTLGEIHGDVRVVEIPFTFAGNRKKAWSSVEKLTPFFNKQLEKSEFVNLGFFEIGMVYFVSQKETPNLASLNGIKIWSWEGDKIVSTMINSMKLVSVPLALPDVLGSLSTGIVQAAYAPPMGMIALQWNTKIKYLVDFPIAYSVGAFLVDIKRWNKIPKKYHAKIREISTRYIALVNKANVQDNIDAMAAMKEMGIKFLKFPKKDVATSKTLRKEIIKKLSGKLFSKDALKRLEKTL